MAQKELPFRPHLISKLGLIRLLIQMYSANKFPEKLFSLNLNFPTTDSPYLQF